MFKAVVSNLSLADLLMLKRHTTYTGCIRAEYGDLKGEIYFLDGEIRHAELGNEGGEEVIEQILTWPEATISSHAGVICASRTIDRNGSDRIIQALLNMIHVSPANHAGQKSPVQRSLSNVAARLQAIDSVAYAVVHDNRGMPQQDNSIEATVLAEKGLLLADIGNKIGDITGMGAVKTAAVQTQGFDQLMYYSNQHYLSVAVASDSNLGREEAKIRDALQANGH